MSEQQEAPVKPSRKPRRVENPKKRGPKPLGETAMTSAQRNTRWRKANDLVGLQVPRDLAHALSELRRETGERTTDLLYAMVRERKPTV